MHVSDGEWQKRRLMRYTSWKFKHIFKGSRVAGTFFLMHAIAILLSKKMNGTNEKQRLIRFKPVIIVKSHFIDSSDSKEPIKGHH